ncbi:MAG: rhomboid family intramembrane serine protease [Candidatus Bathyarchaeota archaeon]|nr:MAG: rhomboid family intramembrane serine protease [Candidatus Bathyarchaeota archaeon]
MFPIHDENRPTIKPYVNYVLLAVNVAIFFFFYLQDPIRMLVLESRIWEYGAIPRDIIQGENLWTLITSMFMHADMMHLFGNMIYLWVFGDNIEDALGHMRYIGFYILGGFAASFVHIASVYVALPSLTRVPYGWYPAQIPSVGASGAISAVLGAYMLLYPRARIRTLVFYFFIQIITVPALYYLGFWFFYQLMMGFFSLGGLLSGVAFWAHIGGFVAGVIGVKAFGIRTRTRLDVIADRSQVKPTYVGPKYKAPFVDAIVEGDRVRVVAELPGVDETDIQIRVSGWELVISAERGETAYYKQVVLPFTISPQVQDLDFKNGVLSFTVTRMIPRV